MPPKLPLPGIRLATKTGLSLASSLSSSAVAPRRPPFHPRSGVPSAPPAPRQKATMGRSGYDTTNMKVAAKPRPAGNTTATTTTITTTTKNIGSGPGAGRAAAGTGVVLPRAPGGGGQSKGMSTTGQSGQGQQGHASVPRIPTHQEIWGNESSEKPPQDMPPPRLVGRGCPFYP